MSTKSDCRNRIAYSIWLRAVVFTLLCVGVSVCREAPKIATKSTVVPSAPSAPSRRPNVLLIVVDALRYDAITGPNAKDAPFMTALASSAATFTSAFSTQDSTIASHFSMLSGFVSGWQTPLDDSPLGVPAQLSRAGYDTFGVAANGNLTPASLRLLTGFNRYACLYDEWQKLSRAERRPFKAEITGRLGAYHARDNAWNEVMMYASAPRVVARFGTFLASAREPFFGFVNLIEPHDPYLPLVPPREPDASKKTQVDPDVRFRHLPRFMTAPDTLTDGKRQQSMRRRLQLADGRAWSLSDDLTPGAIQTYRARYQAEVTEADVAVSQILAALDARGLLDSTVLIITSDHGEAFGESGLITHSFQNGGDRRALQHVPLFLDLPGEDRHNAEQIDTLVTGADIAPTVYDLAGVDWRPIAQGSWVGNYGRSLLPLLHVSMRPLTAAMTPSGSPSEQDLRESRRRALQRLRALGYID
jgi:arylsulfatase A-like enzyme